MCLGTRPRVRGYVPGNEAMCLGTRLCAWERGYVPGNEAMCLGTRLCARVRGYVPGNEAMCLGTRLCAWERGYVPGNEAMCLGTIEAMCLGTRLSPICPCSCKSLVATFFPVEARLCSRAGALAWSLRAGSLSWLARLGVWSGGVVTSWGSCTSLAVRSCVCVCVSSERCLRRLL